MRIANQPEDIFLCCWSLMLGGFLICAPWYLGYTSETMATLNAWACGSAVVILAVVALGQVHRWPEYAIAAIGLWLCAAPCGLGFTYGPAAIWSQPGLGVALVISAGAELWRLHDALSTRTP